MKKLGAATAAFMSLGIAAFLLVGGRSLDRQSRESRETVSDSNSVSSQEPEAKAEIDEAFELFLNGEKYEEGFWLEYNWYGDEYAAEDSLNKTMMMLYQSESNRAPMVFTGSTFSIVFAGSEGKPSAIKLTQYGNTVRSPTEIPFDTVEPDLVSESDISYSFTISFRRKIMYYYVLECEWPNGNSLKYAFAVERRYK